MSRAPAVIHHYGKPMEARMPNGDKIVRQDAIFVQSRGQLLPCLEYDNHFVYETDKIGSSLMCTCGSAAAAFGYRAYSKYCSYMGENVIGCIQHLQTGRHADGST